MPVTTTLDTTALQGWLLTHATGTGLFAAGAVLGYEPKKRLAAWPTFAGWFAGLRAVPQRGGMATTAALLTWTARIHYDAIGADQTTVERSLMHATDQLFAEYFGDLVIAGMDAWLDAKGQVGEPIASETGFLTIDNQANRVATITVGVVIDNAWAEVE
jgi:hypothetical protein